MNRHLIRALTMTALVVSAVTLLSSPLMSLAGEKALDTGTIERLSGVKGELIEKEGVFKVSVPRNDLDISVAGVKMTPPPGAHLVGRVSVGWRPGHGHG